jgi:Listeria-Bacteroides repeat domain (List_Bact_rpt).
VILMLVLMGSVSAVAQGDKLKKVSYAKSGDLLQGTQLYARTNDVFTWERKNGYSPYPWILYLENGGHVQLELPDGQKHQVGLGKHSFTYNNGEDMYIDVRVVPYAVPYLGGLRLHDLTTSDRSLKRLTSPDPEGHEEFYQYTISSDNDLKLLSMNTSPGPAYLMMSQSIPTQGYWYGENLASQVDFAKGVSVDQLKKIAVSQGLDPKDFVVQVGIYGDGGLIYSDIYRDKAKGVVRLTWIHILDKRPQIKKVTLTTKISPVGAGSVLINEASQSSIQVDQGTQVHLKAQVARQEYEFDHWEDAPDHTLGNVAEFNHVVSKDQTITAVFKKKEYVLKAVSSDETLGTVNPATLKVKAGDEARFTATAKENAIFKGWKEKGTGEERNTPVLYLTDIQKASEWIAVFEKKAEETRTLTVKVEPEQVGKVLLNGENQSSITVKRGTSVRLKAEVVDQNYEFRSWKTDGQVSLGKQNPFDYPVAETETVIAVFEKKASAPQVGPVEINFGQREALLTWAAGSATSWIVKVYQGEQVVFDQEIQTPQLVLVGLKPGENYRYEIVAKMSGKLPSQAVQGSFRTDQFDVNDLLTPYLKNFSKLERNKSFPIILLDVDPRDFPQEMTVEAYSLDEREVKSSLTLRNDGKIYWMILPEGNAKALVFVLKSGSEIRYELTYDLSK